MKPLGARKTLCLASLLGLLALSCSRAPSGEQARPALYPISSDVHTTREKTVVPAKTPPEQIQLHDVAKFAKLGYGVWTVGPGQDDGRRMDLMPPGYAGAGVTLKERLLRFFTISDIHITDKEAPNQLIYLEQWVDPKTGKAPWFFVTSIYSPIMMCTTQLLDAAVQTINALHKRVPFDFGLSLGDTCNCTQYNELRWYIDVLDGKVITPSSGAHAGASTIDYQRPFKAVGLDRTIPWYQALGNHDHFWIGSLPVDDELRKSFTSDRVMAAGDVLSDPRNIHRRDFYMGVLDGSTPFGDIVGAGPVAKFPEPPKVVPDPDRRSLTRAEWMQEFFKTTTNPPGHGFDLDGAGSGFACYSFAPKSPAPLKVIVLDDTQREDDGSPDIHGHGFLDQERWAWLKRQLADGEESGQLMIIAAHVPIGVEPEKSELGWWPDKQNAVTMPDLIAELQRHPNLILWVAGHRHVNAVKAFPSPDPARAPEKGFWQVETSALRDFPQQFRTFEVDLNSDDTVSIFITDVDPAVREGTPAGNSRHYAVAAQQIVNNDVEHCNPTGDPTVRPMPNGSYNAELMKKLSPETAAKIRALNAGEGGKSKH